MAPVALTGKFDNPIVVVFALFTLAVATLSANVAANIVSPSYDFSNAWPKRISFRTGVLVADYWWIRRTHLNLPDRYRASGVYKYTRGWNWIAVVALLVGIVISIGG